MAKNPPVNAEDIETQLGSLGQKDPGGWHGNPLQYPCLENPLASYRGNLASYRPKGHKESDTTVAA